MKALKWLTATLLFIACQTVWSDPATSSDAGTAWTQLTKAEVLPAPPAVWETQPPSPQEVERFYKSVVDAARNAAERARVFYTQFPNSAHALEAKELECRMLRTVFIRGNRQKDAFAAWVRAQNALLADPKLTGDDRFEARVELAQSKRADPGADWDTRNANYEDALRQLIKDFPQRDQAYKMLLTFASESSDDKARAIAKEIMAKPVSNSVKEKVDAIMRRLNGMGKPLDIQFMALDGREVDLNKMRGKVVLVDFWATWCSPCVEEIPHVKEAYAKYHSKGFEVVGISFDAEKQALTHFIQVHDIAWPQYFDGKVWDNKFGQEFAIDAIPAMWLVDKNGNLQSENARADLQGEVEKLLEEN
jgi:thiol-disulfide isomerase/thioredoxin